METTAAVAAAVENKEETIAMSEETTHGSSVSTIMAEHAAPPADGATSTGRTRKRKCTQQSAVVDTPKPRKKKKAAVSSDTTVDAESEFAMSWICTECKEAECMLQPEATELMVCDGVCRRLFHYPCAGLSRLPTADEPFVCSDCQQQRHVCSICLEYGVDSIDVFPCKHTACGLFFHVSCLTMQGIAVQDETTEQGERAVVFRCPAHQCWTCTQEEEKRNEIQDASECKLVKTGRKQTKKKKKKSVFQSKSEFLSRCLECARAYHVTCIPPNARFHELATLCHEHAPISKLPELNKDDSLQMKLEKAAESKSISVPTVRVVKKQRRVSKYQGINTFFHGLDGDLLSNRYDALLSALAMYDKDTNNVQQHHDTSPFRLPAELRDEVHAKPPSYRHVNGLQYAPSHKPPRVAPEQGVCDCPTVCDEGCINRTLYTECFGDATTKESNCKLGLGCGNRQFGQRLFAKCKPQREKGRGWGLVPVDAVYQGDLVIEYVGEVIDEAMKDSRLQAWSEEHPNDPNFYIMELQPGWFIDARNVANLSRFINHACDPNCRLTQINCRGKMRCGIFALRDIPPGEFLSYDYHFDTRHGDQFICCCGSTNCRGTMKGGVQQEAAAAAANTMTPKEKWDAAKADYDRDRKFVQELEQTISLVSDLVPAADPGSMDESVAAGPRPKFRERHHSLFLWRNAVQGSNFCTRIGRKTKGAK